MKRGVLPIAILGVCLMAMVALVCVICPWIDRGWKTAAVMAIEIPYWMLLGFGLGGAFAPAPAPVPTPPAETIPTDPAQIDWSNIQLPNGDGYRMLRPNEAVVIVRVERQGGWE